MFCEFICCFFSELLGTLWLTFQIPDLFRTSLIFQTSRYYVWCGCRYIIFLWEKISPFSRKNLRVKSQIVQGNEKIVPDGKFELKVDFGSVIMFNTSKTMICYLLLTRIIKSNMIFINFWHIGDFHRHKLTLGRFYRL